MSAIDDNPFAEPANENPFSDPSVTQVTSSSIEPVDQYNPFQTDGLATHSAATSSSPYQPAVLQPSTEPGPQATAAAAQANLLKQQEELERKAAALDRREQELQSRGASGKVNNWPPLPKNFPIKPCFYQDFSEEIPSEYQRVCKMMYYLWMCEYLWPDQPANWWAEPSRSAGELLLFVHRYLNLFTCLSEQELKAGGGGDRQLDPLHFTLLPTVTVLCSSVNCVTLFLNVLACLAFFIRDSSEGMDFGLSILWFILFTPCSFLCWYRPIYKAFKTDSSVSFFFFFFVFFCQVVIFIIQAVGIPSWGNSGWVTALSSLRTDKAVGAIMIIVAILFTFCASLSVVLLKMVHGLYRRTGASFHKAQQEFSQGVFTSKNFQTAASSAAQGALQRNN